jgi:hypothetical protein
MPPPARIVARGLDREGWQGGDDYRPLQSWALEQIQSDSPRDLLFAIKAKSKQSDTKISQRVR